MNIILFIIFIIVILAIVCSDKVFGEKFQINNTGCLGNCQNDPLTQAKCWQTKAFPCPKDNGSFTQCSNNFKRDVNIADCLERTYYYSQADERLSEKCVYEKTFPFAVKPLESTETPSIFPRINVWRNDDIPVLFV